MTDPKWWKESVIYQIYPKSFCDSNGDGIGDIPGIISKLDYLKELGVDGIWVCPMYPSPGYDNGYDISDYEDIDPIFGTMEDFDRLISEVHARNMKLIIDLVLNHTSSAHPWFQESRASLESGKRNYYIWRKENPDGSPPNNWGALFGGSAWTPEEKGGEYYLNLFSAPQPDLNWRNPALRQELYAIIRRWLERGVDGFRMDVISLIAKPEDFEDGPTGRSGFHDPRARAAANPQVHEYIREMRREAFEGHNIVTVGEASATSLEEAKIFSNPDGSELNMVFQFEHMDLDGGETFKWTDQTIPIPALKQVMTKWQLGLHNQGWNGLFWNNHDQPRMVSRLGDEGELRERSAKMLATCLHLLQGTPFVYQGEELGMTSMDFTDISQLRDSESINAYNRYVSSGEISHADMMRYISMKSRDSGRTPMQWNDSAHGGFTTGTPWMPVNPNYVNINAAEQENRQNSVFSFYKELIALRKKHKVIVYGGYEPYCIEHPEVFSYFRKSEAETLLVCCNFSSKAVLFPVPEEFGNAVQILGNVEDSHYLSEGILASFEAVILKRNGG